MLDASRPTSDEAMAASPTRRFAVALTIAGIEYGP